MRPLVTTWQRIRDIYDGRYDPERLRILAIVYWDMLLLGAGIGFVVAVLFGFYIFTGVMHNLSAPFARPSATPDATLNRAQLDETLNAFLVREAAFDAVQTNVAPAVDPSR